jgi:hypothetical protein
MSKQTYQQISRCGQGLFSYLNQIGGLVSIISLCISLYTLIIMKEVRETQVIEVLKSLEALEQLKDPLINISHKTDIAQQSENVNTIHDLLMVIREQAKYSITRIDSYIELMNERVVCKDKIDLKDYCPN